jgi:integrase
MKVRYVPINTTLRKLLLFSQKREGRLFTIANPRKGFQAAVRRALLTRLRFHDLRHTFATRAIIANADIDTIKRILGHSSLNVTQKYVHSGIEQAREAVESLARHEIPAEMLASKAVN